MTEESHLKPTHIVDDFEILEEIGSGAFSRVHIAKHIPTGTYVAVKDVNLAVLQDDEFNGIMREISVFMQVDHPNICHLYRLSIQGDHLYFFMEFAPKGTLLSYVNKKKGLTEQEACPLFVQLFSALRHLHISHFLVHRDLKLENVLLDIKGNVKLTDFGLAGTYYCNQMRTFVGTPGYTPPEIISGGDYDEKCDVWSLGICLYAMVTASLPFTAQSSNYRLLVDEATQLELPKTFSPALQDLLKKMLAPRPSNRLNLTQLQSHPWLRGLAPLAKGFSPTPIIFYKVKNTDDILKFKRHSIKAEPAIVDMCVAQGIDAEELTKALADGVISDMTTYYFCMKYPMPEKPPPEEEPQKQVAFNGARKRSYSIEQKSRSTGSLNRLCSASPAPGCKGSSIALRKSTAKAVVTPTRKPLRPPLKKP